MPRGLAGTPLAGDRTVVTRVSPHALAETKHDFACVLLEKDLCLLSAEMFDFLEDKKPPWQNPWVLWGEKQLWVRRESPGLWLSAREEVTASCRGMVLACAPAQHTGNALAPTLSSNTFVHMSPQKTDTFSGMAAEVRKCSPQPLALALVSLETHPLASVGGRFFTNFSEGCFSQRRNS